MFKIEKDAIKVIPGIAYMREIDGRRRIYANPEALDIIEPAIEGVIVEDSPYDKNRESYNIPDRQWSVFTDEVGIDDKLVVFVYHTNLSKTSACYCGNYQKSLVVHRISRNKKLYNQISDEVWSRIEAAAEDVVTDDLDEMFEALYQSARERG